MSHRRRSENGLTIRRPRKNNSRGTTLVLSSALKSTTAANTSERSFCVLCATSPCKHSYCRRRITATTSRTPLTSLPTRTSGTPRLPQPPCRTRRTDAKPVCVNLVLVYVAPVPRGHSRFCTSCADTVASMDSSCVICRTP